MEKRNSSHTHTKSQISDFPSIPLADSGGLGISQYAGLLVDYDTTQFAPKSAGSSTKPVYFNYGKPVACSYTLGSACQKGYTTSVTSGSTNLITSGAVYTALQSRASKETGTWTPSIKNNPGWQNTGYYSKIGNLVTIWCFGYDPGNTGSLTISSSYPISGLPYAGTTGYNAAGSCYAGCAENCYDGVMMFIGRGKSTMYPRKTLTISSGDAYQIFGQYLTS